MDLIIADTVGRTVERYRVIYCSQELEGIIEMVIYPDDVVVPTRKVNGKLPYPITAVVLAMNTVTHEAKRFVVAQSRLTH
ncbi:hypothetical protein pEaSNUABM29_00253 [Erwinia phage pEa_SNUABM_29]|nr:hypothetical protein pEaSNUABM29_00253 [Erwinia phage pEa_SNUABM_29]